MDDWAAFLNARIDEVEAAAKALAGETWTADVQVGSEYNYGIVRDPGGQIIAQCGTTHFDDGEVRAAHIARHDPARALREVQAKRAILTEHRPWHPVPSLTWCSRCHRPIEGAREDEDQCAPFNWPCPTIRALVAIIWSDHPDYPAARKMTG